MNLRALDQVQQFHISGYISSGAVIFLHFLYFITTKLYCHLLDFSCIAFLVPPSIVLYLAMLVKSKLNPTCDNLNGFFFGHHI